MSLFVWMAAGPLQHSGIRHEVLPIFPELGYMRTGARSGHSEIKVAVVLVAAIWPALIPVADPVGR